MPRQPKAKGHASDTTSGSNLVDVRNCLCLICRQAGHLAKSCPQFPEHKDDDLSTKSKTPITFNYPFPLNKASAQALCKRCARLNPQLDILAETHSPDGDEWMEKVKRKLTPIPPLGPITSIELLSTCPLCRLMFDITYLSEDDLRSIRKPESEDEGQLALVPAWTLVHLDPAQQVWPKKDWGPHTVCLYTAVTRARSRWQPQIGVHAGTDAIAIIDKKSGAAGGPVLGVQTVDPKTPDYSKIKEWLRRCDELHHITCQPRISEGLDKIKLVNVDTREIVRYPSGGCDYIALSYVWGGVVQPGYKLGDILPRVPATLEDAMVVIRHLGKRYLWADSLCIDQGSDEDKESQIPLMSAIYTGAWATIFNLAGTSARSGLPRVGILEGVIPQLSCEIGGRLLLSLMPPLTEQLSESLWNTRAWTFQEALLSPRRLLFTNHQVYFECNLVQCCESIDDSRSPFHLQSDSARKASLRKALDAPSALVFSDPDEEFEGGTMRDPFRPIFTSKKKGVSETFRIWKYEQLVHSYTSRRMTMDSDALNAFSAILTRFRETHYQKGFVHGLPAEDLPTALLWTHDDDVKPRRRDGFPSWSWVGWEGAVTGAAEACVRGTTDKMRDVEMQYIPPLRVWKAGDDGRPELVYDFNPTQKNQAVHEDGKDEDVEDSDETEDTSESPQSDSGQEDEDSWDSGSDEEGEDTDASQNDSSADSSESSESLQGEGQGDEEGGATFAHTGDVPAFLEVPSTNSSVAGSSKRNPLTTLAKTMFEETPSLPQTIDRNDLLIQGIVFRLALFKLGPSHQDPEECAEWCRIKVQNAWRYNCMMLYGHNRAQLVTERQGKEQEFLLCRRNQFDLALMLIDREGDTAKRVGVASLVNVSAEELWTVANPEVRLIRLV